MRAVFNAPMSEIDAAALARKISREVQALPKHNTPSIRAIRSAHSARLKNAAPRDVVALAHALRGLHLRWVGYEILTHHKAAMASLKRADVEALAEGLDTWDGVDTFGLYISGPAWRAGALKDGDIKRWAKSDNLWIRRAALVSTVVLNSKSRGDGASGGDAARTLAICALLVDDREDMVVKALSWALRVLAAVDPRSARNFLDAHGERLAARVRRETRNKLRTGVKNPKR